jgi:hypothetical protein
MNVKALACLLPAALAYLGLVVPTGEGLPVDKQEAQTVFGSAAQCWYSTTGTFLGCDPTGTHGFCFTRSWGNRPTPNLASTYQIASDLAYPSCPCSSGASYAVIGNGVCASGS